MDGSWSLGGLVEISNFAGGDMSASGTMLETSGVEVNISFAGGGVDGGLDGAALARLLVFPVICSKTGNKF